MSWNATRGSNDTAVISARSTQMNAPCATGGNTPRRIPGCAAVGVGVCSVATSHTLAQRCSGVEATERGVCCRMAGAPKEPMGDMGYLIRGGGRKKAGVGGGEWTGRVAG